MKSHLRPWTPLLAALWVGLTGGVLVSFVDNLPLFTQGDVWDTQWDMFLALCGSLASQLLLATRHDRALQRMGGEKVIKA